jgi:acetyl-CoA carboxylase biotin carboxyl carrier protein
MYKLSEIRELIKMVDQSSVQELEIQNDGIRVLIRKASQPEPIMIAPTYAPQPAIQAQAPQHIHTEQAPLTPTVVAPVASVEQSNLHKVVSPMVGTFYRASSPGAAAFVEVGSKVNEKSVVCIVEAMKLLNDIESEVKGEIVEILVENGQLVEYGQPLFLVKKE